ncbi:unnamed protein product [Ostreobium quekettii]|uniref:Uncharacterized protein n=1 Tax=Ostreobium quekettii TaxID=121088 RepID=A0A8S1IRR0_9CHLO|nr:unnamed protein product [Ostreobium quekettii]
MQRLCGHMFIGLCFRCHTPLIRSRDKALYCVGCELLTVVEEQATSPQAAQSPSAPDPEGQGGPHRGGQKRSQDERSPRLGGDPPPEKKLLVGSKSPDQAEGLEVEKGMMDVEFGDSADVDEGQGCTDVLIVGGGCEMDHRGMNPGGHKVDSEVKGTAMTVALQQTVLQKMAEVGSLVSQTPVTQTEELSKRLDLLKECIGVVKALKDLKI